MNNTSTAPTGRILLILFLGVLMAALDIAIVGPALPAIREHFGVDERSIAWVFNTFVLLNLVGVPLMSKLSDIFGRRRVYAMDVALFGAGSALVALAPSFDWLLVGRAIQGLAASGIFPVASAVVGDTFVPEKRGQALGVLGAVFGLAFIIGPILAGILLMFSWKWLFVVNLPLAGIVFYFSLRLLPDSVRKTSKRLDWQGMGSLCLFLLSLAYGITLIDTESIWRSLAQPRVWTAFGITALMVPVFIAVERRAADPLLRLQLLNNKQVVLASLLAIGAGLTEAAFIFFPALAVTAFEISKSTASFMLLPLVVAVAISSPIAGRILDRVGSRLVITVSAALLTLGMATVGIGGDERLFFYVGSVLIGLGLAGLLGSSLSYILLNESREAERTISQGVITLFISIGQLTGGAFIGAVAASGQGSKEGYMTAFLVIAGIGLALTLLALQLKSREAEREGLGENGGG